MATTSLAPYSVTNAYTDVIDTLGAAADVDTFIQNVGFGSTIELVLGGTEPAATVKGILLDFKDSLQVNTGAIWVRNFRSSISTLAVVTL